MIKSLEIYLIMNGNGKEAVDFYVDALNGKLLNLTLYKEHIPNCPKEHENLVLNAQIMVGNQRLMISDENPAYDYKPGYNMSACIIVDSVEDAKSIFNKLSVNAKNIPMELQETFWSPAYANVEDKFGILWQISTEV